jgi:hypothetical protein
VDTGLADLERRLNYVRDLLLKAPNWDDLNLEYWGECLIERKEEREEEEPPVEEPASPGPAVRDDDPMLVRLTENAICQCFEFFEELHHAWSCGDGVADTPCKIAWRAADSTVVHMLGQVRRHAWPADRIRRTIVEYVERREQALAERAASGAPDEVEDETLRQLRELAEAEAEKKEDRHV